MRHGGDDDDDDEASPFSVRLDWRNLRDPGAGPLKHHIGLHSTIQLRILGRHWDAFKNMLDAARLFCLARASTHPGPVKVAFACRAGRHRSVAMAAMVGHVFEHTLGWSVQVKHVQLEANPHKGCRCMSCSGPAIREAVAEKLSRAL